MKKNKEEIDPKSIINEILELDVDSCEVQLCLAALGDGGTPDIQRVQISKDVATEFQEIIKRVIIKRHKDTIKGNLVLKGYDPQAKLDSHEVEHLSLCNHVEIKNQIDGLSDLSALDVFSENDNFVSKLRFYLIVLKPKNKSPILFFRTYTPKKELNRSKLFAIVLKQGTYDRFNESLFLFDHHVDCMVRDGVLFIFNKDKFQKIFRFYEMLVGSAKRTLQFIQQRIPIDDFAGFETACEHHLQKLAKLKNIASKPYLQKITMDDIKKVIRKYNLPITIVGKGNSEKIKFDASDKWAILRLLDDDYLESVMTGNSYEVNSKRSIQGS